MDLCGRTILITGGTSGIGAELVKELSEANHTIIVIGRNDEKLADLGKRYKNVVTYNVRLDKHEEVASTIRHILETYPDLSVIFNNAAVQYTPFISSPDFRFDSIKEEIEVNLSAPLSICALSIHHFLTMGKTTAYINISSGLALYPKTTSSVYCATKAAIHSFSQSFRYQLAGTKISVFEVLLPLVDTSMTKGRGNGKISPNEAANAILKGISKDQYEIYVGKSKLIPLVSRISPALIKNIMKNG